MISQASRSFSVDVQLASGLVSVNITVAPVTAAVVALIVITSVWQTAHMLSANIELTCPCKRRAAGTSATGTQTDAELELGDTRRAKREVFVTPFGSCFHLSQTCRSINGNYKSLRGCQNCAGSGLQ